jgi:hypothetical protein
LRGTCWPKSSSHLGRRNARPCQHGRTKKTEPLTQGPNYRSEYNERYQALRQQGLFSERPEKAEPAAGLLASLEDHVMALGDDVQRTDLRLCP